MEPERKVAESTARGTRLAWIDITYALDAAGQGIWSYRGDAPHMASDIGSKYADQVCFKLTDDTGKGYRIKSIVFTDKDGNPVPQYMKDYAQTDYDAMQTVLYLNDVNTYLGPGEFQINYTITLEDADGGTASSDPVIWDVSGGG